MGAQLEARLLERLRELPVLDVHTHLVGGRLAAGGLHDVLLYHMAVSDLYAAGCPNGARLTQYPGRPDDTEAAARLEQALPYLPQVRNTSTSWMVRTMLADLYDWHEPVTADNWRRLDGLIRERATDANWPQTVMQRSGIRRYGTELARRGDGGDDARLQYALEWAFFTRCQWGEYDTALYELERCWGRLPDSPAPIGAGQRPATERTIAGLDDVHEAVAWYVDHIPCERVLATATHISTDLDLTPVGDQAMRAALDRRATAGPAERDVYAAYVNEAFLSALEARPRRPVFQFSFGAEPLPFETASRLSQTSITQVAAMIARHPGLQFQCFLSCRHANQALCSLARELPNLSLAGYWWHNFSPDIIRQVMSERLDMLPLNRQIGFFSDAYVIEWTYAKLLLVLRQMAQVLAEAVRQGRCDVDEALAWAATTLYDTPRDLLGLQPMA